MSINNSGEQTCEALFSEVLEINGEKFFNSLTESHQRPFTITQAQSNHILKMISTSKSEMEEDIKKYLSVWSEFIESPEYFYSKTIREALYKDLQLQIASLTIGKSPLSEIAIALHEFDCVSKVPQAKSTTNAVLSLVEEWLGKK